MTRTSDLDLVVVLERFSQLCYGARDVGWCVGAHGSKSQRSSFGVFRRVRGEARVTVAPDTYQGRSRIRAF